MTDTALSVALLANVGGALALILLIILAGAWLVRRFGGAVALPRAAPIVLQGSCSVGQRERLLLVEVQGKRLLLGVTAGGITCLAELDAGDAEEPARPQAPDFSTLLARLLPGKSRESA